MTVESRVIFREASTRRRKWRVPDQLPGSGVSYCGTHSAIPPDRSPAPLGGFGVQVTVILSAINTKVYDARLGAFSSKTQASMKEGAWLVGGQKPAFSPRNLVSGGGRTFRVAASQCLIRDEIRRGDNILLSLLFRDTH